MVSKTPAVTLYRVEFIAINAFAVDISNDRVFCWIGPVIPGVIQPLAACPRRVSYEIDQWETYTPKVFYRILFTAHAAATIKQTFLKLLR